MSNNHNFYNKFHGNNATFQNNYQSYFVPPPPVPPPFFIPPSIPIEVTDKEFIENLEQRIPAKLSNTVASKPISISEAREKLCKVINCLNDLKTTEKSLANNIGEFSEEEWSSHIKQIELNKSLIDSTMAGIKGPCLDVLRKLIAKRAAKRLRMKRVCLEIKREKEERAKELKERSLKIDENLQKIKDVIMRAQQEQETKLEADMVLKEVSRKKHDAKKCIVKLDALVALRKARHNTAMGRGQAISESETVAFNAVIEKLRTEWTSRLSSYEEEEAHLRSKLKDESTQLDDKCTNVMEREVVSNLEKWKDVLFGGQLPQVDFRGDIVRFIAARSQWDQYINKEGTIMPMGWVTPSKDNSFKT